MHVSPLFIKKACQAFFQNNGFIKNIFDIRELVQQQVLLPETQHQQTNKHDNDDNRKREDYTILGRLWLRSRLEKR